MKTEFLAAARSELEEAIGYYDEQRAGLGIDFADEVVLALGRIKHYP